jgi:hypothetical protein
VPVRYFTPEEANEALAEVRPLAERMVAHRRSLAELQARRAALAGVVAGNGGDLEPRDFSELEGELARESARVARCVNEIHGLGAQVKDVDEGLVDFPARRGGEEVLLCWRIGEDAVAFWHGLDEGFAGRKPLPL